MNKKRIYKINREILKNIKTLDDSSIELLNQLGFTVKYDSSYNLCLFDDNNERMYTNVLSVAGIPFRSSENKNYILEFCIINRHINNVRLYKKEKNNILIYEKK